MLSHLSMVRGLSFICCGAHGALSTSCAIAPVCRLRRLLKVGRYRQGSRCILSRQLRLSLCRRAATLCWRGHLLGCCCCSACSGHGQGIRGRLLSCSPPEARPRPLPLQGPCAPQAAEPQSPLPHQLRPPPAQPASASAAAGVPLHSPAPSAPEWRLSGAMLPCIAGCGASGMSPSACAPGCMPGLFNQALNLSRIPRCLGTFCARWSDPSCPGCPICLLCSDCCCLGVRLAQGLSC